MAPLLLVVAAAAAVVGANAAFADRALPGVAVAGIDVGTLPPAEIRDRIERELARPWAAARVTVDGPDGRTWTTTNAALAIAPDADRAVADALAVGHTGGLTDRLRAWASAVRGHVSVPYAMRATGPAAETWLSSIAREIDRPVVDGAVVATYRGIDVTEPVVGRESDRTALRGALLAPETLGDRTLRIPVREIYPAVAASGMRDAAIKAQAATTPLEIRAADAGVREDAAGLATLLSIEKTVATAAETDAIPAGAIAPPARYAYHVRVDDAKLKTYVTAIAAIFDHPAKNASYAVRPDGSLAVIPAIDGLKIDQSKLVTDLAAQLFSATVAPRVVTPPFVTDTPAFTTAQAAQVSSRMTQVSSFTTTYPPSASRHANITTGAMQFNDVVIAPGEVFSFWDRLGPVTVERGYAYAGAIIDNRSDENVIGGGLCQVSTTLFNSVARVGYAILERHEHGYYIDRYPLGFDAAVFEPGEDFRWRNDTAYPVLIKAFPAATSLRFDLFSVPTGRRVIIGEPVQKNLTSPAPTQPADPAYAPGAMVQGRDVSRSWTVLEGDRVIHDQTFFSHYVPVWGGPAR